MSETTASSEERKNASVANATNALVEPTEENLHKVFVSNLSFSTTEESLQVFFKEVGDVLETIIIKQGHRPKGYGFVAYGTLAEAEKAIKNLDKRELDGREINVQLAKPRQVKPFSSNPEKKKKRKNNKKSRKNKQEKIEIIDSESSVETPKQVIEEPKPKTSVFVANLPRSVKVNGLIELFKDFEVESALVAIQHNGYSKGYGFVELKTVDEMNRVLKEFVNVEVQGRPLHISVATSEKKAKGNPRAAAESEEGEETPKPTKKNSKKRKSTNKKKAKEKEEAEAAKDTQEAVKELKEDGIKAADTAQEVVKELKREDGIEATHEAPSAMKELNKEGDVKAAKEAKEAVRVVKEEEGTKAATASNEANDAKAAAAANKSAK